jgi:hypothetical protein
LKFKSAIRSVVEGDVEAIIADENAEGKKFAGLEV